MCQRSADVVAWHLLPAAKSLAHHMTARFSAFSGSVVVVGQLLLLERIAADCLRPAEATSCVLGPRVALR